MSADFADSTSWLKVTNCILWFSFFFPLHVSTKPRTLGKHDRADHRFPHSPFFAIMAESLKVVTDFSTISVQVSLFPEGFAVDGVDGSTH